MEYISLRWYDIPELVAPIMMSLIEDDANKEATEIRVHFGKVWLSHHFKNVTVATMTCFTTMEYLCKNYHRYVPLVVNTSWSFPHSRLIIGFVTRLTWRVPLEHLNSHVISGIRVTRILVVYVCFIDRCLSFCIFFLLAIVFSILRYTDSDCTFGIFNLFLVKSRDLTIELLTISSANGWKLSGLELKDILIQ
jgi:hypothetical protein